MANKVLRLCVILLLLATLPVTVLAQEWDPDRLGSLSLSLVSRDGEVPLAGAELALYYVASVEADAEGALRYFLTEPFAGSGISLEDAELTEKLDAFVSENTVSCQKTQTDGRGNAFWDQLPLGLYFVKQTVQVAGSAPCTSFLVTVPMTGEDGYVYDVDASPKTEVAQMITVTVQKIWNTDESTKIPNSVTVRLLRGEQVLFTDVLNSENNWRAIHPNMPESDAYWIEEVDIPNGFTATYARKGYVFTVTNTSSLVQTGQLIWPIPVLALAGMFLLLMGFAILRKTGKRDA